MIRVVSNKSQLIELLIAILGKEPGLSQDVKLLINSAPRLLFVSYVKFPVYATSLRIAG